MSRDLNEVNESCEDVGEDCPWKGGTVRCKDPDMATYLLYKKKRETPVCGLG